MNEQHQQPAVNNETENEEIGTETEDTDTQSLASEESFAHIRRDSAVSDDPDYQPPTPTPSSSGGGLTQKFINTVTGIGKSSTRSSKAAGKNAEDSTTTAATGNQIVINGQAHEVAPAVMQYIKDMEKAADKKKPKRLDNTKQEIRQRPILPRNRGEGSRKQKKELFTGLNEGNTNWIKSIKLLRDKQELDNYIRDARFDEDHDAFTHTMRNLGYLRNTKSCSLSVEDFNGGSYLRVWDLGTSGDCTMSEMAATVIAGDYQLEVTFEKETKEAYSVVVIYEQPSVVTIKNDGNTGVTLYG